MTADSQDILRLHSITMPIRHSWGAHHYGAYARDRHDQCTCRQINRVAELTAAALITYMPELGHLNQKKIACLAPIARQASK